ncbi:hypothetical protein [Asanoa siamensis]|uniref:Uncharacterized protein n=1 Tax=Asanoa siamensis TaxID=926357 RepID=A0ABQ4CKK3_9ACTN|nr:hypothetical protein [Asanoa siamensis]GIF71804.1 hypothetical protein Asi02nite_13220 [Asanoa siamensis]
MLIDCSSCAVRGAACPGCLVTALLDAPAEIESLDADELRAIEVFARAGFEVEVVSQQPAALRMARPPHRRGYRVA